ncbi:integrase [Bifidobacterium tissieri]|uniref:Integrase n=1 Tax=Bifidobacterium tissieri TaxID=1630162 RepID=A0A261F983_9BIFI|nr:IS607 family transposase [Bifidobacterium tissieri]OZG55466.1 integrase [Bifidobacterium tissieri]
MRVKEWAAREGLNEQTVWKWCRENRMPVPFERSGSVWLIHDPKYEKPAVPAVGSRTVCYARVSSSDRKDDLQRQADRLKAFAINMGVESPEVVTETGSGMNDRRRRLNRILADSTVGTIIVEHRDRLARMDAGLVESALKAAGRRLIVVDDSELDDDLVCDMTEVLTSFCARLYGRHAARNKAEAALRAAHDA